MNRSSLRRRFALLEMLYWLTYGAFTTYLYSFVTEARGGSATVAGLMLALFMGSACFGQIVIGSVCDRKHNNRIVYMAGLAAVILIQLWLFFSPNMILLGCACVVLGFVQPPLSGTMDTWLIHSFPDEPNAYAPLRAFGSIAYAGLMAFIGYLIEHVGHFVMPILSTMFALGAIAVAYTTPEIPSLPKTGRPARRVSLRTLPGVVWLFVGCMTVLGMSTIPLLNMNLPILENVGGTVTHAGIATSFNTVAEFIIMRHPKPLQRFNSRQQLLIAGLLYAGSTVMMFFAGSVWLLYIAFFVNGIAYGVLLPARRALVGEIVPAEAHNRVHALGDMAYLNFGGLVGNQASGLIIDSLGVRVMIGVSVCVQCAGLFGLALLKRGKKKN